MDVKNIKDSIKQDIKAELKPRKLLRTAFVPNTKGLLTPIKEVFEVFVLLIAQIFVSAKLIDKDHPVMLKQVTGFSAISMVIIHAASNLEFKRENLYQIIVFYGIVGMLIFGVLDLAAFLMHYTMGHAHADTPNTSSYFSETTNDNGQTWINTMFPVGNNTTASAATLPYALQNMLTVYNNALLAMGTALALWQIAHLFIESAHHGTFGGKRYSQLYAPMRLVLGIGLLVPMSSGFNSAQIIAIDMAKMGSGLASNVWMSFQAGLTGLTNTPPSAPVGDTNLILQQLLLDQVCLAGVLGNGAVAPTTNPTWTDYLAEATPAGVTYGSDSDATATSFVITFDSKVGVHDAYCGSITIPSNRPNAANSGTALAQVNWYEQAYVNDILNDVWAKSVVIYNNSLAGSGNDTTASPFNSGTTGGQSLWTQFVGLPGTITVTAPTSGGKNDASTGCGASATATASATPGELTYLENASVSLFKDYEGTVACAAQAAADSDWTKAGFLFLKMSQKAGDLYSLQNPNVTVNLPNPEIMYGVTHTDSGCSFLSTLFGSSFPCGAGKPVATALASAAGVISAAAQSGAMPAFQFDTASAGGGGNGNKLSTALAAPTATLLSQLSPAPLAGTVYQFGNSIFHVMMIGNIILFTTAGLYLFSAVFGGSPFTADAGLIIALFATSMWPIGVSLAIMIPLMPAARFVFGIFAWMLTLFEAIVAMPVVALVTIQSDGDGLFAHGKAGWFFLLQMMLRPVLMIFGLLGGVLVFDTLSGFITQSVMGAWVGTLTSGTVSGAMSALIGITGFLYFYVFTLYSCANISFQLINTIPDRILQWIGTTGISALDGTDSALNAAKSSTAETFAAAPDAFKDYKKLPNKKGGDSDNAITSGGGSTGDHVPEVTQDKGASTEHKTTGNKTISHDLGTTQTQQGNMFPFSGPDGGT